MKAHCCMSVLLIQFGREIFLESLTSVYIDFDGGSTIALKGPKKRRTTQEMKTFQIMFHSSYMVLYI